MTDRQKIREYFIFNFFPSVLSDDSRRIGILLREFDVSPTAIKIWFIGARFVANAPGSGITERDLDEILIGEAIREIQKVVKRSFESGQQNALDTLLGELLSANSGFCALGPHPCPALGDPEVQLQTLFEGLLRPHA
ncbi:MAG TPA: hypothetical protein VMT53_02780 [Terriglobales bacterium]|nr:hypothetical protein [Terriglobales bacterium]